MIIIQCDEISYSNDLTIRFNRPICCPECKLQIGMWRYGYRKRKVIDFQGNAYWIRLPKYNCQKCGKIFWTLPSFLVPYKHYDRYTIETAQKGCTDGCGASYLSIYLWKKIVL